MLSYIKSNWVVVENNIHRLWYRPLTGFGLLLMPFSLLYQLIIALRRFLFRLGLYRSKHLGVPVVIVGNINIGGTGKSPMVGWLARWLSTQRIRVGIISRGYRGTCNATPQLVNDKSQVEQVGDEAIMLWQQTQVPVVVCKDRVAAVKFLLQHHDCQVIVSDDGLQHYRLKRDIEIVMLDGKRRFGNQHCLPAGPLREPLSRLHSVDFIIVTQGHAGDRYRITLKPQSLVSLKTPSVQKPLSDIVGQTVHAIAGISHPERFFESLRAIGADVIEHPFPDHYGFCAQDMHFDDSHWVIMTAKDAVKCCAFASSQCFFMPIGVVPNRALKTQLQKQLVVRMSAP